MASEGGVMSTRTVVRRPANHALHLILTVLTLGMWSPVWAVAAIVGRRETVTTHSSQVPYGDGRLYWGPRTRTWR